MIDSVEVVVSCTILRRELILRKFAGGAVPKGWRRANRPFFTKSHDHTIYSYMETVRSQSLWTFIVVFLIFSALMWVMTFIPIIKLGMSRLQNGINSIFEEPLFGIALFGIVLLIYFSRYYTAPNSYDLGETYISTFVNIWVIFLSGVIVAMTIYKWVT